MQSTKRHDNELQGSADHGRIAEDDQMRPGEDEIARTAYERYEREDAKMVMRSTTGWTQSET